jgi:transcriptional regulator with PAS, ATPase and Fis domain
LCQEPLITPRHLPANLLEQARTVPASRKTFACPSGALTLSELEKQCLRHALERTSYNQVRASKLLGLTRTQLRTRMKNHQLEKAPEVGLRQEQAVRNAALKEPHRTIFLQ